LVFSIEIFVFSIETFIIFIEIFIFSIKTFDISIEIFTFSIKKMTFFSVFGSFSRSKFSGSRRRGQVSRAFGRFLAPAVGGGPGCRRPIEVQPLLLNTISHLADYRRVLSPLTALSLNGTTDRTRVPKGIYKGSKKERI